MTEDRLNEFIRLYEGIAINEETTKSRKLECFEILRVLYFIQDGNNHRYTQFLKACLFSN